MLRAVVVATMLVSSTARADDAPAPVAGNRAPVAGSRAPVAGSRAPVAGSRADDTDEVSTNRRLAAIGAAIIPGVVLHGSGSWVLREKRAAKRLAITGGIGLGAMALGGAAVGISGGHPSMTLWGVPLIIVGASLFVPTWFADIWHAAGGPRVRGAPHAPAAWSVDLGTSWLHDAYRERALVRGAGRVEIGRIGIGVSSLVDAEGRARTGDLETRVRVLGAPAHGGPVADGSRLYVRAAVRRHDDDDDKVAITTGEIEVGIRADLQHLDRNLAGTFLETSLGMGLEQVTYADLVDDRNTLFLGRFAWGVYLGSRSELAVFYDHRRDSLAGGIAAGRAAGFVGSVGTTVDLRVGGPFSLIAGVEIGSGWVTTAGIRYHGGPL